MKKLISGLVLICLCLVIVNNHVRADVFTPRPIVAVIIVDTSGSMRAADPNRITVDGARLFIDLMEAGDSMVAVVPFSTYVGEIFGFITLDYFDQRSQFIEDLGQIPEPWGFTDIGHAFARAYQLLDDLNLDDDVAPVILFFTDGRLELPSGGRSFDDANADIDRVLESGRFPIFSIGLNYDGGVDEDFLHHVSYMTGAMPPLITDTAEDLIGFFSDIFEFLTGARRYGSSFHLSGERERIPIQVPELVREMNIVITSDRPLDPLIELYSPAGSPLVARGGAYFSQANHYTLIKVVNPVSGPWILSIDGEEGTYVNIGMIMQFDVGMSLTIQPEVVHLGDRVEVSAGLFLPGTVDTTLTEAATLFESVELFVNGESVGYMRWDGASGSFVHEFTATEPGISTIEVLAIGPGIERRVGANLIVQLFEVNLDVSIEPHDASAGDTVRIIARGAENADQVALYIDGQLYTMMERDGLRFVGEFFADEPGEHEITVTASGSRVIETSQSMTLQINPSRLLFFFETDKEIYNPRETVYITLEIRRHPPIEATQIPFTITHQDGEVFYTGYLTEEDGMFTGSFRTRRVGEFAITAQYGEYISAPHTITVSRSLVGFLTFRFEPLWAVFAFWLVLLPLVALLIWHFTHLPIRMGKVSFTIQDRDEEQFETYEITLRGKRNGISIAKLRILDKIMNRTDRPDDADQKYFARELNKVKLRRLTKKNARGKETGTLRVKGPSVNKELQSGRSGEIALRSPRKVTIMYYDYR